jgi:hypothetical protein
MTKGTEMGAGIARVFRYFRDFPIKIFRKAGKLQIRLCRVERSPDLLKWTWNCLPPQLFIEFTVSFAMMCAWVANGYMPNDSSPV